MLLLVILIQVILGTQVREALEGVKRTMPLLERGAWLEHTGLIDQVHRSFSWLVAGLAGYFFWLVKKRKCHFMIVHLSVLLLSIVVFQILSGIGMAYASIPPFLQVMHLWLSAVMIMIPFIALLLIKEGHEK